MKNDTITKAIVYTLGTVVITAAVFSFTMATLKISGQDDTVKIVIDEMDDFLGI